MSKKKVAIFIFNDVEVLDFAGPFEVFSVTSELNNNELFEVYTVAEKLESVTARNGLSINPSYQIANCPTPNILIIPGGFGIRELMNNSVVINWIQDCSHQAELVLSVCTGALLLAISGLLVGLEATTHHQVIDDLRAVAPTTQVLDNQRFVDNGQIITSAGISAGIDMCLYVVYILLGKDIAVKTAKYMEYNKWEID